MSGKDKIVFGAGILLIVVSAINIFLVLQSRHSMNIFKQSKYRDCPPVPETCRTILTESVLERSLNLGKHYLLNSQNPDGSFIYMYNWITKRTKNEHSQVRQAGALWGLSLIYHNNPDAELARALQKGIEFFERNSNQSTDGKKWITFPEDLSGKTGTVALYALSLIDALRRPEFLDDDFRESLESNLEKYLSFLVSLRTEDGLFYRSYTYDKGKGFGSSPSPYFDGETLLALTKAAKYLDRRELIPIILASADAMYTTHVDNALRVDPDSDKTKGFFQWGIMSFFELATSDWKDAKAYGHKAIDLANWMIDVHCTLSRSKNTAYAYEGIILARELARQNNDFFHVNKFTCVTDKGLRRLASWQVGGPMQNSYLRNRRYSMDKRAMGGVMNSKRDNHLRIDVTQHQMHAVILALRYIYNNHTLNHNLNHDYDYD
jgi:UDP-N-acetylmuramoyl-tripeptide--D-alanyl-D-alanine ligase